MWPLAVFISPVMRLRAKPELIKSGTNLATVARVDRSCRRLEEQERSVMATDSLDAYIDAVAKALRLPLEEAWKPAVRANLDVSLRLARLVDEFALPDETEPASVFVA
jgi:hypothetical protein